MLVYFKECIQTHDKGQDREKEPLLSKKWVKRGSNPRGQDRGLLVCYAFCILYQVSYKSI